MNTLSLFFRATLLLILLTGTAMTASAYDFVSGGIYYNITSSTNMTVAVTYYSMTNNTYSGTITIPEKVTANGKTYYVTAIGNYAFVGCTGLNGISFASNKITSIGNYAFSGCNGLNTFTIPNCITSIGYCAFNSCYSLSQLTIEDGNQCLNLAYNSDNGKGLFNDCPINSVFIGRPLAYDTSNGHAPFANNTNLSTARLGKYVTSIQPYLFYGCTSFKTLNYNDQCLPTAVESYAFCGCESLIESDIHLPTSVKTIGNGAFSKCTSLLGFTIPDHVTTVGDYAFQSCSRLANLIIKPSVTSIGYCAFNGCYSLSQLTIEEGNQCLNLAYNSDNGKGLFYDCPLNSVFIGRPLAYDTSNGHAPFANNTNLTKARLGKYATTIQPYLFYGCTSFKTLNYNDQCLPTAVESYAFCGCESLTESDIHLPTSVKTIGNGAFSKCTSLLGFTIPDHVTTVGDYAFQGCSRLANLIIKPSVTSIGYCAFNGCYSLSQLTIEEGNQDLNLAYNSDNGKGLFYDCPLSSVFIGRHLSYQTSYGYSPFANLSTLVKARLGKKLTSIPFYLFYGCSYLDEITSCAAVPPTAIANCFANYDARLYVPKNSVNSYRQANVWKDFSYITGVDVGDDEEPIVPGWVVGDVDGDGKVNIDDVTALINYLLTGHF